MPLSLGAVQLGEAVSAGLSHVSFDSCRAAINKAIELARSAEKCQCIWIVRADEEKKWVRPCGAAIASTGQIVLQPGQIVHL